MSNVHRKLFSAADTAPSQTIPSTLISQMNISDQVINTDYQQEYEFLMHNRVAPPDLSNVMHLKRSDSYFMSDELRCVFRPLPA